MSVGAEGHALVLPRSPCDATITVGAAAGYSSAFATALRTTRTSGRREGSSATTVAPAGSTADETYSRGKTQRCRKVNELSSCRCRRYMFSTFSPKVGSYRLTLNL
jgi:hypothetical protein